MGSDTVTLTTSDGLRLQGDVHRAEGTARGAAVVCHPHPLYGGDRFNTVVDVLWRELAAAGLHTLRFDFRGTNDSQGTHGHGVDETSDVLAGIDLVDGLLADDGLSAERPIWLVGYSFGAMVALDVTDPRVTGWVGVAAPLAAMGANRASAHDERPTLLLVPEHDRLGGPETIGRLVADWSATTVEVVPMADHSLTGRSGVVVRSAVSFVTSFV